MLSELSSGLQKKIASTKWIGAALKVVEKFCGNNYGFKSVLFLFSRPPEMCTIVISEGGEVFFKGSFAI